MESLIVGTLFIVMMSLFTFSCVRYIEQGKEQEAYIKECVKQHPYLECKERVKDGFYILDGL